ncbi:FecR family protein [Pedobacter africanus]|uniref:FecR family protein n=1 Tax=Pedobacter africanus TaxID=151894 RepID=A0A1W2EFK4_9SPHI|nr:FecR family protein [Pedobacter africanus]SMD08493.1 FecR family protein [Pedobacter africanus]
MNKKEAQELLDKYAANLCTPEEKAIVERWYAKESAAQPEPIVNDLDQTKAEIWTGLQEPGLAAEERKPRFKLWIAAASLLFMLMGAGFYFYTLRPEPSFIAAGQTGADQLPGRNEAILVLADGSRIILGQAAKGTLATEGNTLISKVDEGQLNYKASVKDSKTSNAIPKYNTISTPKGGQYRVVLPDGTIVWLNAASSIRFPTSFDAAQRNVELTGEAYFEVAVNRAKPFNVAAGKTNVRVLGTHFNVMAYPDEASVNTTLLEGSVKVSTDKTEGILRPGEQAQALNGKIAIKMVDPEEAVAWKKGYFYFKDADIRTVMRQVSRWYDVEVEYQGNVQKMAFSGKMYRNVDILKMLEALSYFNVDYKLVDTRKEKGKNTIVIK